MFDKILGGLTLVRHAVAITLVMGAATATVAGSMDVAQGTPVQATTLSTSTTAATTSTTTSFSSNTVVTKNTTTSDLEAAINACLATKAPQSVECLAALDKSGLSNEDFWAKLAFSLSEKVGKNNEPSHNAKPDGTRLVTGELIGLVTACVESHERASEACAKALTLSGLTTDEFFAKVSAMFKRNDPKTEPSHTTKPVATPPTEPKPTTKPATTPSVSTAQLEVLVKDCFAKYLAAAAVKGANDTGTAASDACHTAIAASGLSSNDFWAKFGTPAAPR